MSREQRTRLNIMISEQTGAAQTPAPGRTTRTEQLEDEQEQAPPLEPQATRRRSVFDAPHVDDVAREPASDDDSSAG